MPKLLQAIDQASGWVLYRQMISPSILQMRVEAQGRALMHLYASLMEEGLELSRDSHLRLTERCTCAQLHQHTSSTIVTLQMNVTLPSDVPLLFGSWQVGSA